MTTVTYHQASDEGIGDTPVIKVRNLSPQSFRLLTYRLDYWTSAAELLPKLSVPETEFAPAIRVNPMTTAGPVETGVFVPLLSTAVKAYGATTTGSQTINCRVTLVGLGQDEQPVELPLNVPIRFTHVP